MRNNFNINFLFSVVLMILCTGFPAWAEVSLPQIDLTLDKTTYVAGEPVGATVTVSYAEGNPPLLISDGFQSTVYYLELRIVDPAGELLLVKREAEQIESPDAPPLAFIKYNDRFLRVADCEVLDPEFFMESRSDDLRRHYDIGLPGAYSVQVQVSAAIFRGEPDDPCNIKDYAFKGVLKSETKYFYVEGTSEGVKVIPRKWRLKWTDLHKKAPKIKVHIWPMEGETTADYKPETFRLNEIEPNRVKRIRLKGKHGKGLEPMLKAYFPAQAVMETLDTVIVGQWYNVYITGEHKVGDSYESFGRFQQIQIVE